METLSLLTLWQTDEEEKEEEDSFFDIDFTVPIKRKNNLTNKNKTLPKQDILEEVPIFTLFTSEKNSSIQSKRFSNNVVIRKYMKMIKPFYNKASKFKFSDEVSANEKKSPLREVCRQLRKSRSASSGVGDMAVKRERRDDSLLQQHDGIQSAILHCRRSYYSSRDPPRTFKEEEQRRISI